MPHVAGHMETLALFTLTHGDFDVPPSDSEALSVGYSTEDPVASGESDAGDANQASSPLKNTNPTEDERNKTNTCPNCDRKVSSKTKSKSGYLNMMHILLFILPIFLAQASRTLYTHQFPALTHLFPQSLHKRYQERKYFAHIPIATVVSTHESSWKDT